ncbi:MAG: bacteriocin-protection protein [Opitutus sp.]|nr:bacteriocin-protection protein [Opitutus sp.]
MKATFFKNAAAFRTWLETYHTSATEFQVGFYKKASGKGGLTYQEAVDEALCFGWIDGIIRRIDGESYQHRFTPRRPESIWSNVNIGLVARLTAAGKMSPAGLAAFAARDARKTGVYSFESKQPVKLPNAYAKRFKASPAAWKFFTTQAPWYQRAILHKIVNAKQKTTRERWLARAIAESAAGRRIE